MQMIFTLDNAAQKPLIRLDNFPGCTALIDTGAMLPMWIKSEKALIQAGGIKTGYSQKITTADGKEVKKDLYRLTVYMDELIYNDMPILLSPINNISLKNVHIILAATNFRDMIYTIDTIDNKLILEIPDGQKVRNVKVLDETGNINIIQSQIEENIKNKELHNMDLTAQDLVANYTNKLVKENKDIKQK